MAQGRDRKKRLLRPTLDDCEDAMDFLEDVDNYDWSDQHCVDSLSVRVHDYPEGSGKYLLLLTWIEHEKPLSGSIPIPPGWEIIGDWFFTEKSTKCGNIGVWRVGLMFKDRDDEED